MIKLFGGCDDDAKDGGKAAYALLTDGGRSGFSAILGGWRDIGDSFSNLGDSGYYWSSTESDASNAWFYHFSRGRGKLRRQYGSKTFGRSCRCVQD